MIDARDTLATLMRDGGYKQTAIAQKAGLSSQQLTDIIKKRRKFILRRFYRLHIYRRIFTALLESKSWIT